MPNNLMLDLEPGYFECKKRPGCNLVHLELLYCFWVRFILLQFWNISRVKIPEKNKMKNGILKHKKSLIKDTKTKISSDNHALPINKNDKL